MAISIIWFGKVYSWRRKWAVLPIICGVALAFYGDLSFTIVGATYTFLCVFLAALKVLIYFDGLSIGFFKFILLYSTSMASSP